MGCVYVYIGYLPGNYSEELLSQKENSLPAQKFAPSMLCSIENTWTVNPNPGFLDKVWRYKIFGEPLCVFHLLNAKFQYFNVKQQWMNVAKMVEVEELRMIHVDSLRC